MESFSGEVKKELSEINSLANKSIVKYELQGYLLTTSSNKFITESKYNINRFSKLLSNTGTDDFKIEMQGNKFCITTKKAIKIEDDINDIEAAKAIVRGSFMGAGSITNPQNTYHLEIVFETEENARKIKEVLKQYDIENKILKRDKNYIIYIKDGEIISRFLAFIGANKSVLKFEETRVIRDVRNNINRIVNCETANINKVIKTSIKQIEDIKLIKEKNKFDSLTDKEKELAELRIKNPDATLTELGKMLKNPIGKSGVNHRMKVIADVASELRGERVEK